MNAIDQTEAAEDKENRVHSTFVLTGTHQISPPLVQPTASIDDSSLSKAAALIIETLQTIFPFQPPDAIVKSVEGACHYFKVVSNERSKEHQKNVPNAIPLYSAKNRVGPLHNGIIGSKSTLLGKR